MLRIGVALVIAGIACAIASVFAFAGALVLATREAPTLLVPLPADGVEAALAPGSRASLACRVDTPEAVAVLWSARSSDGRVLAEGRVEAGAATGDEMALGACDVPLDGILRLSARLAGPGEAALIARGPAPRAGGLALGGVALFLGGIATALGGVLLAARAGWKALERKVDASRDRRMRARASATAASGRSPQSSDRRRAHRARRAGARPGGSAADRGGDDGDSSKGDSSPT